MVRVKKMKLENQDYDFAVFAIVSAEDDYHLVWQLNNTLLLKLEKSKHSTLEIGDNKAVQLGYFFYLDEEKSLEYSVFSNKYSGYTLFPQYKTIDFMLKISGCLTKNFKLDILSKIRNVKCVIACINLDVEKSPLYSTFERI